MVAEPVLLPPSVALGAPPLLSSLLDKPPGKETINGSPRFGDEETEIIATCTPLLTMQPA